MTVDRQTEAIGDQFLREQGLSLILEIHLDTILQLILKQGVTLCFFLRLVFAYFHSSTLAFCISNLPVMKRSLF